MRFPLPFAACALVAALAPTLPGQTLAGVPSPLPLPAAASPLPLVPPAQPGINPVSPAGGNPDEVSVQFLNVKLPFILLEYEALTGRKIIRDAAVEEVALTIDTTGKMTRAEAAQFIEKSLLLNGYAFVPAGGKTYKILAFEGGKQPRTEAPPVFYSEADLPEGEEIVSFVVTLNYLESEEAAKTITKIIPPHSYGDITPIPNARALVITENSSVIRRILELKKQIDRGPVKVVQRTFALQRSDAEEVVKTLSDMLGLEDKEGGTSSSSSPPPPPPVPAASGQPPLQDNGAPLPPATATATRTATGEGSATTEAAQPRLHAIVRTNRVLAVARPEDLDTIAALIKELDAPAEQKNFVTLSLHYLSASEILPILQDALSRGVKTAGQTGTAPGQSAGLDNPARTNVGTLSNNSGGTGIGGAGSNASSMSLGDPEDLGGPKSLLVGKTLVIADPVANELSLSGPPEQVKMMRELIDQLDKRPRQIFLTAVVGQLTLGDDFEFGIDFLRNSSSFGGSIRTRNGQNQSLFDIGAVESVADLIPAAQGFSVYGRIGNKLNVFLSALENTNRFKVLARPSVFALNNTKAVISTGQRVPIPVSSLSSLNPGSGTGNDINTSVTSNIQYQDVVLRLEVIPQINDNGEVTLRVVQVNDDIVGQTNISGNNIPTIGTQGLTTTVMIPDRSSVLLGGLISESVDKGKSGIPVLNKIPVIKYLAGSTRDKRNRRELLIFLQPRIVNSNRDLPPNYRDGLGNSAFGAESAAYFHNEQDRAVRERIKTTTRPVAPGKAGGKSPAQPTPPPSRSRKK